MKHSQKYPQLSDNICEKTLSEAFDHHGWHVEEFDDEFMSAAEKSEQPILQIRPSWRGLNSRGYSLMIGRFAS